jgi:glycerol uptake facilitator protein
MMEFLTIFLGELIGTFLLILLGVGVTANVLLLRSKGRQSGWIVICTGWGFAVAIAVYATGWASGGHLNPAVTLGLTVIGKSSWDVLPVYWMSQMIGAFLGAIVAYLVYYPHWKVTPDAETKLLCFATRPAIRKFTWNFVAECVATAVLLIGILGIYDAHNGLAAGFGPYAVGILILAIGLCLGGPTGFSINPARDLGPRLAHTLLPMRDKGSSDWAYAWVPIFAPLLGSVLGAWLYHYVVRTLRSLGDFQ